MRLPYNPLLYKQTKNAIYLNINQSITQIDYQSHAKSMMTAETESRLTQIPFREFKTQAKKSDDLKFGKHQHTVSYRQRAIRMGCCCRKRIISSQTDERKAG